MTDELEALRRWKSTNAPRLEALEALLAAAQIEAHQGREAVASLASERAANAVLTDEIEALRKDAARLDWIERVIQSHSSFWLLPCGEDLRFVQVRHFQDCANYPTVVGVRAAIDAAMEKP